MERDWGRSQVTREAASCVVLLIAHYSSSEILYYKRPFRSGEVLFFYSGVLWSGRTVVRTASVLRAVQPRKKIS